MSLSPQQRFRRRRIVVFSGLAVALAATLYVPLALLAPIEPVSAEVLAYVPPVGEPATPNLPDYGASAIAAVGLPGLLAVAGRQDSIPIASISKVITTLVVLDRKPIPAGESGETITFTEADLRIYDGYVAQNGSVKPVTVGLQLSQREVIEAMLVGSANNYARSLVNWAFGSEAEYASAATAWLETHGMPATFVVDATGMSPGNVSTTADLVTLGQIAIDDPIVSAVISEKSVTLPAIGALRNTNKLLGVDGIDGIKTGTLDEAGACLLFSADLQVGRETVALVGVVLGGPDHGTVNRSVRELMSTVAAGFQEVTLASAGDRFASYTTPWGESTDLVAAEDTTAIVWSDTPVTAKVSADRFKSGAEGNDAGTVTFAVGSRRVEVELELATTIEDPGPWWRLANPEKLFYPPFPSKRP